MSFDAAVPAGFLIALALFARLLEGSWFAPGAFHALYFSFLVTMTVFLGGYRLWPWALWWIFIGALLFFIGSVSGGALAGPAKRRALPLPGELRHRGLHVAIPIGAALGIGHVFLSNWYFSIAPTFDDIYRPPLRYQVLITFIHVTPMMGGIYAGLKNSKFRVGLGVLSLFPLLFGSVVFSSRSGLVMVGAQFCAGYFSMKTLVEQGKVRLFTLRHLAVGALVGVGIYWMGFFVTMFRIENIYGMEYGDIIDAYWRAWGASLDTREDIWEGFRIAYTGGIAAFSVWFETRWYQPPEPSWGYELISGVYELLGYRTRAGLENVEVEPGVFSNVYTRYGPLAHSFSLYGSQVWLFAMGLVFGWAYRRLREGSLLAIPFMVVFYLDVSNGGFAFNYNSIIAAYAMVGVYAFWWNGSLRSNGRAAEAQERTAAMEGT